MNNNRTNRRRGRGNRNQGGGSQGNRIDSRARGNAPQLLDKYKKLAQDAQHNGDRVQAEYYLQFADHYFRVIADNKSRQDEQRGRRNDERDSFEDDESDEDSDERRSYNSQRNRNRRDPRDDAQQGGERDSDDAPSDDGNRYEPDENPFLRESTEAERPRRRTPRRNRDEAGEGGFDASVLPPSIVEPSNEDDGESKPAARTRRKSGREDGGKLSAVG